MINMLESQKAMVGAAFKGYGSWLKVEMTEEEQKTLDADNTAKEFREAWMKSLDLPMHEQIEQGQSSTSKQYQLMVVKIGNTMLMGSMEGVSSTRRELFAGDTSNPTRQIRSLEILCGASFVVFFSPIKSRGRRDEEGEADCQTWQLDG
uniref:Uncharacterized protein n=1 Tax=Nelumbo nucifera TaxID=4432 RepID=A0A822YYX5_NELNU|nr:TPA_asm: hypothetical protein HUJ06_007100 [Nelumbo nucifera]